MRRGWSEEAKQRARERWAATHPAGSRVGTPALPPSTLNSHVGTAEPYEIKRIRGMYYALQKGETWHRKMLPAMTPRDAVKFGRNRWKVA